MERTQKRVVDLCLARGRTRQPGVHGVQMPRNFGPQDLQQDRIDRDCPGFFLGHGLARRFRHGSIRRRLRVWRRGLGSRRGQGRQHHVLARSQAIGYRLHRRKVDVDRPIPAQGSMQPGQDAAGMPHEGHHGRAGRARAIQDPIEHVLDVPGELAQHFRTHQPTAAFQGVEYPADGPQRFGIVRRQLPGRQQAIEVADLFLELL